MVSKQTAKRKRTSNTLAPKKRRRTTLLDYTSAPEPHRAGGPASEMFWAARRILKDNGSRYLVEWEGIDPGTGRPYKPTWEPHDFVTPALEAEWKEIIAARSTVTGHTSSQAQSFEEADNRMQSLSGSPGLVTSGQPSTKRVPQCQTVSTNSPQQMHQSQRSSSSLFLESQQSACALVDGNSYTCGVILARQNNVNPTISTTTTLKETSGSNQRNLDTAIGSGHTDEDLSATDPTALSLRHSLHAQSLACIEKVDSVGIMQLPSHSDPAGMQQEARRRESELPENLSQEGLELARRESQKAHACTLEEKGLPHSALLTTKNPSETQEQQQMQSKLDTPRAMSSAPANEAVDREPEPVLTKTTLVPLQGGTVEEQRQALVGSERLPGRLSKDCWAHEKAVIRHTPAEPDVNDESTRLLARSDRSISPFPKQSGSILQHPETHGCTLPVLATDRPKIALSALSSQLGLRLDTEITAGQTFAKPDVNAPARGRNAKLYPLPAAALAMCARHTSEQNSPPETETRGFPALPALNRSVRGLEVVPDREMQVCVANSMCTIDGEQTAPIIHDSFTSKPLSCGKADQDSASMRYKNGCHTINHSISPVIDSVDMSPRSHSRRPRSTLERANQFSDELAVALQPVIEPPTTMSCGGSSIYRRRLQSMELAPQHIQPPGDYCRYTQRWTTRSQEPPQGDSHLSQHRDACPIRLTYSNTTFVSELHIPMRRTDLSNVERAGATKPMQRAVQVEPRRKKPHMKRAKTGCETCRRRKKKCDEAKPECNNCTRIGIICQGYGDKMVLQKNKFSTFLPSLPNQTRMPMDAHQPQSRPRGYDLAHILNDESSLGSGQSIHEDSHAPVQSADTFDGGVTVEERRFPPPATSGGTGRHNLSHISCPREQLYPPALHPLSPLAPVPVHETDLSNEDRRVMHPIQTLPLLYHNPRIHGQIPQSVDRGTVNPSAVASEAHQQRAQSLRVSLSAIPTAAPPKPSLSWHKQAPSPPKTEKQRMLDGESFLPYSTQLVDDRRQCAAVLYHFNNTVGAVPEVAQRMRERYFRAAIEAAWTQPRCGDRPVGGRLGSNTYVAIPFHCDYGYNVSIGDNVIMGPNSQLLDSARISIGRNTRIGGCVTISTLKAPTDTKPLKMGYGLEVAEDIYIGENVYIGDRCVVGAGVRVGDGAIVRPGSVVVHDIPPDYIAYGNPANMYKAS